VRLHCENASTDTIIADGLGSVPSFHSEFKTSDAAGVWIVIDPVAFFWRDDAHRGNGTSRRNEDQQTDDPQYGYLLLIHHDASPFVVMDNGVNRGDMYLYKGVTKKDVIGATRCM
jgi:hypothetical protein